MKLSKIEKELEIITKMIWQPLLQDELVRVCGLPKFDFDVRIKGGCVHIIGGWCGTVSVEGEASLVDEITNQVLQISDDSTDREDWKEVIKELANVTGGNIKGLLGENCILSTPRALSGYNYSFTVPETPEILRLCFCANDQYLVVKLHEGTFEFVDS